MWPRKRITTETGTSLTARGPTDPADAAAWPLVPPPVNGEVVDMDAVEGFAEVVQQAARVPALEEKLDSLERIVDELARTRKTVGSVQRNRMLTAAQVQTRTGLSRPTIYRYIQAERFPKQIKVGSRAARWCAADVDEWINDRRSDQGAM